jgi:hypothetical protein
MCWAHYYIDTGGPTFNLLPQYDTAIPAGAVAWLHIVIQFRMRVLPTARRLARIHTMPRRLLHNCPACGGDVPESMKLCCLNAHGGSATVIILGH